MAIAAHHDLSDALQRARARTLALVAPFDDEALERVQHPLMSPLDWDLGHIAAYEDLWIAHRHGGRELLRGDLAEVYDAFETPRAVRGDIPFLRGQDVFDYLAAVRERTVEVLEDAGPGDGTLFELVIRHEAQHNETMRQTLFLAGLPGGRPSGPPVDAGTPEDWIRRARRPDRHGRDRARLRLRQRAPAPPRRRARVRDRAPAGDERHVGALLRGRRLRAPRMVVGRGLGLEGGVRHHPP